MRQTAFFRSRTRNWNILYIPYELIALRDQIWLLLNERNDNIIEAIVLFEEGDQDFLNNMSSIQILSRKIYKLMSKLATKYKKLYPFDKHNLDNFWKWAPRIGS